MHHPNNNDLFSLIHKQDHQELEPTIVKNKFTYLIKWVSANRPKTLQSRLESPQNLRCPNRTNTKVLICVMHGLLPQKLVLANYTLKTNRTLCPQQH